MTARPAAPGRDRLAMRTQVEIGRLAHLLGEDPARLAYLEQLSCEEVVELREVTAESLHAAHDGALRGIAAAARLLPVALTAAIGQRAFGPLLCARLAGLLELSRAVDVAGRLPAPFLAEVAGQLDPARARDLVARLSPELIGSITGELAAREDWYAMGRFVGGLGPEALSASIAALDDRALLEVAFVIDDRRQLPRLIGGLTMPRLRAVIARAAADDLWAPTLELVDHLGASERRRVAAAAAGLHEDSLPGLLDAVVTDALWDRLEPIVAAEPQLGERIAHHVGRLAPRRRRQVLDSAEAAGASAVVVGTGQGAAGRPSR